MSRTRIYLLSTCFLIVFLAINRVDQLFWTFFLGPKLFHGDSRGPYGEPLIGSVGFPEEPPDDPGRKSWPLDDVRYLDREIIVLTGTTFTYDGISCRLLGVQESSDPIKQEQAKEFAKFWFNRCSSFYIHNERAPLVESEVSIVSLGYQINPNRSYLSEELVRSGLVRVDHSSNHDYEFEIFDGDSLKKVDWKGRLALAADDFANGKISNLFIEWQEALNSPKTDPSSESDVMP